MVELNLVLVFGMGMDLWMLAWAFRFHYCSQQLGKTNLGDLVFAGCTIELEYAWRYVWAPLPWEIGVRCSVTGWRERWREPLKEGQIRLEDRQQRMDGDCCSPCCISYAEVVMKLCDLEMNVEEVGGAKSKKSIPGV